MATQSISSQPASAVSVPPLCNGDHLSRAEFERRYAVSPEIRKAELIEGVVLVQAALSVDHGQPQTHLTLLLATYCAYTPHVGSFDNTTVRLDDDNEPQPDLMLRIDEKHGGQSKVDDERLIAGAPELAAEIAVTSASYDLHSKLRAYCRNGVREYIVWRVLDKAIDWFALRGDRYEPLPTDELGVIKSETFPGLWLNPAALLSGELAAVLKVLQQGIATDEHQAFCRQLAEKKTS
jgi:Uma2 family endonuclease